MLSLGWGNRGVVFRWMTGGRDGCGVGVGGCARSGIYPVLEQVREVAMTGRNEIDNFIS